MVELIVSVLALKEGLIRVVQASLLGSVLSNLLLVLGFSFLFGGIKYPEQRFNQTAAQTSASLLAITVASFMLPAAFANQVDDQQLILDLSRGSAVRLSSNLSLIDHSLYFILSLPFLPTQNASSILC